MRLITRIPMLALALMLAVPMTSAHAADACSLDGIYAASAFASDQTVGRQAEFWLAFSPDADCDAGAVWFAVRDGARVVVEEWAYRVTDNAVEMGTVALGGTLRGQVAMIVDGVAQGITIAAFPSTGWSAAGTALRQGSLE